MDSLFPETPWSLIARVANSDGDKEALIRPLLEQYWQPAFACLRQGWDLTETDATVLLQRFLDGLLAPDFLKSLDPNAMQFRQVLRSRLIDFMAEQTLAEPVPKDQAQAEGAPWQLAEPVTMPVSEGTPEQIFDEQWVLLLFQRAVAQLAAAAESAQTPLYRVFEAHDVTGERPDDKTLGQRLSVPPENIAALLFTARRQLRGILIAEVSAYSADQGHAREELSWLLP